MVCALRAGQGISPAMQYLFQKVVKPTLSRSKTQCEVLHRQTLQTTMTARARVIGSPGIGPVARASPKGGVVMLASLVVAAVLTLALGVAVGWAARGRVAHWCTVHGEPLICNTCRPHPAIGRAAVRWQGQPASTVDRAR